MNKRAYDSHAKSDARLRVQSITRRQDKDRLTSFPGTPLTVAANEPPVQSIWNSEEAARYLRISPRTLTRMARRGEIPSIQIGKLWRFRRIDLDEWLTGRVNSVSYPCRLNS